MKSNKASTTKTAKPIWMALADNRIRHIWACEDHPRQKAIVSPDWYQDNGTPVCGNCGDDMKYVRTEWCLRRLLVA